MEMFLKKSKKGDELKKIDDDLETIYNGAKVYKDISILRKFADIVDKDGKQLLLMPGEETESSAPFLKVYELPDKYVMHG